MQTKKKAESANNRPAQNKINLDSYPKSIIPDKEKFLNKLFKDLSGFIEIREITDSYHKQRFFKSVDDLLEYDPPKDKNIYIGMLTRDKKSGKIKDTLQTKTIWLDFDDKDSFYSFEHLVNLNKLPEPSIIVDSGHGYHTHYILDKPAGREVEPVIKALARKVGADTKATDLARIMRVPGTMNVKNPDQPVKCEIVKVNDNEINLNNLAEILGTTAEVITEPQSKAKTAAEVLNIDYQGIISSIDKPCIKSILRGVEEGQRNWLLGRLTRFLKEELAVSKSKAKKIIRIWREKCDPPPPEEEVLKSFNSYWHNDKNNLLGCKILDRQGNIMPDKQQILNKYCNKSECPLKAKIEFVEGASHIKYNNNLLNKIREISAYQLMIYGILSMNEQGLTAKRGAEIMGITEKTFKKHADGFKYVKKKKGIARRGIPDLYYLTKKGTFKMGRTAISYAATRLLYSEMKNGYLKPADLKIYMILRYYEFKSRTGEVYPATTTLAEKLGTSRPRVSTSINRLEKRDFIEIDRNSRKSNLYKFKIR